MTRIFKKKCLEYELYDSDVNFTFNDFVKLFGPQINVGIPTWCFCIKHKKKTVYLRICKEGDLYNVDDDDKNNLRLEITNTEYFTMFCNYINTKLGRFVKLYDEDDIANITKIQQSCENWLDKPLCKDNTIGINPRLAFKKIKELE